jgi:Ca-activated chloride channel homolog
MGRHQLQRGAPALLLAALLLSGLASAEEEEPFVPDWAQGWKKTWLEAYNKGSLQLSAKITPRYLGNGKQDVFAVLELRSLDFPPGDHPPASVALIIDHSASTFGRRLLIARRAALELIDGLSPQDHLAIIGVSDHPDVLEMQPLTPENRQKMKDYVSKLEAEGRSDLEEGLGAARDELKSPKEASFYRQIVIFSDGRPTDGMVDQTGLAAIARQNREKLNIHTNTVSVGDDADVDLMAGMAKEGWGFAATLSDSSATERVTVRRQLDLVRRAANGAELNVKVGPTVNLLAVMGQDGTIKGNLARIPVGEIGPNEVVRVVLHLATDNVGKQVRPIELGQVELAYEDALTEKHQTQSLTLQAELNLAKSKGRGALDLEALKIGTMQYVKKHTALADETAEDGDQVGAKEMLESTRENLKRLGGQARLEITDAMALLNTRSAQILEQKRPKAKPDPLADKKKKKKR